MKKALESFGMLALAFAIAWMLQLQNIGDESIIMVFLLGVLFTAVLTGSRAWSIGIAVCSVLAFGYFFAEPQYSLTVLNSADLVRMVLFLITAVTAGTITLRMQAARQAATQSAETARTVYEIASGFLSVSGRENVARAAESMLHDKLGLNCSVLLGKDAAADPSAHAYEIREEDDRLGVLAVFGPQPDARQSLIIRTTATQLAIALEREKLVSEREKIRLAMENEQHRSMFLQSVAHDLRSPLTALSGAGSLLSENYDALSDSERRKLAADISDEITWLNDLVENILNMTRISENKMVIQKQDEVIDDVIEEAAKHTRHLMSTHQFKVFLPDEVVTAKMDGKLIVQVVINLLENAARHTPEGGIISLETHADRDTVYVTVRDQGEGIAKEVKEHLFEPFVTQDSSTIPDAHHGIGLGLAICRSIVTAHGGTIEAKDNTPRGTAVTFTLPRSS